MMWVVYSSETMMMMKMMMAAIKKMKLRLVSWTMVSEMTAVGITCCCCQGLLPIEGCFGSVAVVVAAAFVVVAGGRLNFCRLLKFS